MKRFRSLSLLTHVAVAPLAVQVALVIAVPVLGWDAPPQPPRTDARDQGVLPAGNSPESRSLTYVANAGVLVAAGDTKILIDALFDKPNPAYRAPSPDAIERMVNGTAPFDGVTLALVTHNHPDHFDARLALRFLENRQDAVLVAPTDAVAVMKGISTDWTRVETRVIAVDGPAGTRAVRQVKGVSLTTFRTGHGDDSQTPPNVMYLAAVNGFRLLHEGDAPASVEQYRRFGLDKERIDLALVHFWFPFDFNLSAFLKDVMRPAHIALTHLPIEREAEWPGRVAALGQAFGDLFLLVPGMPRRVF